MPKETAELPVSEQEIQIQAPSFLDKLKVHKFKILGGILGVFVLAGAVFGAYKLGQKQVYPELGEGPTPTPVAVATPTLDPTANWKTYTNEKYGYSIKYPAEWSEQLKCEGGTITDDYVCFLSPDFEESPAGAIMGSTVKGGVVLIYGQGGVVSLLPDGFCAPGGPAYISECKEIKVGDLQAMQRKIGDTQTEVGILKTGKFILDIKAIYNAASEDEIARTLNLILSTFRFLPSTSSGQGK